MKVIIKPSIAKGEISAPPSKSYAHRFLICSALAKGESDVNGVIDSKDMEATLNCISALGASYSKEKNTVKVNSKCFAKNEIREFYCNESGSTLRFFIPIALSMGGINKFYGTEKLLSRGLEVYEDICKCQGIKVSKEKDSITFEGKLKHDSFNVRGDISSQFISGLLFALPLLDGDSTINIIPPFESVGYIDVTLDTLKAYGIEVLRKENIFFVKGNQKYQPQSVTVEGDMSNAAFLDAFNILGGDVSVIGCNKQSYQADRVYMQHMESLKNGTPEIDLSNCPDLAPALFALAASQNGAKFVGTRRLKIKESDRAEAMATELRKFGILVDVFENSVIVNKCKLTKPTEILYGHNDHRIVMALSVLSTICGGEIDGCEAVSKSYPSFFDDIQGLGVKLEIVK